MRVVTAEALERRQLALKLQLIDVYTNGSYSYYTFLSYFVTPVSALVDKSRTKLKEMCCPVFLYDTRKRLREFPVLLYVP